MSNREVIELFVTCGLLALKFCTAAMTGAAIGNAVVPVIMEEIRKKET